MARTEEDKTLMAPIEVTLGAEKYSIKLLGIRKSREWRKQVAESLGVAAGNLRPLEMNGMRFLSGLPSALAIFPEKLCDLLFAYDPELPQEKILDVATEEQITAAFMQVWGIAFANFLPVMLMTREMLTQPDTSPPSAKSSN